MLQSERRYSCATVSPLDPTCKHKDFIQRHLIFDLIGVPALKGLILSVLLPQLTSVSCAIQNVGREFMQRK